MASLYNYEPKGTEPKKALFIKQCIEYDEIRDTYNAIINFLKNHFPTLHKEVDITLCNFYEDCADIKLIIITIGCEDEENLKIYNVHSGKFNNDACFIYYDDKTNEIKAECREDFENKNITY